MTDLNVLQAALLVSIILIIYRLLRWKILVATHQDRIDVGSDAVRLCFDQRLAENDKNSIFKMTSLMYHSIAPWVLAFTMIICVVLPLRVPKRAAHEDADFEKQVQRVRFHLLLAVLSASPIAFAIGMLALGLGILLHSSFLMVKLSASQPRGLRFVENLGFEGGAAFRKAYANRGKFTS